MESTWWKRYNLIRSLGWLALAGLLLLVISALTHEKTRFVTGVMAIFLILPAFLYTYVVVIWHWKDRYRGRHSDLWGALLIIETSGWLKLVYLFRHLIPDMRRTGRYHIEAASVDPMQPR